MHIPIISHIPTHLLIPYSHTAHKLQKIQPQIKRDQRFRLRKPSIRRSQQIPCVACRRGAACPGGASARRDQRSVYADPRIQPVYSNSRSNDWGAWASGYGVAATTGARNLPARLKAGHCVCSHILSSNGLATSGYRHQACDVWPAPDSHLLSSRCLSWAGTCICVDNVNVIGPAAGGIAEAWPVKVWRHGRSRHGCRET